MGLIECVPNVSEGRRPDVIDRLAAAVVAVEGVHFSMWRPETHRSAEEDRRLPPLDEVAPGHLTACWHWEEVPLPSEAMAR